jgi:hypothetical protein
MGSQLSRLYSAKKNLSSHSSFSLPFAPQEQPEEGEMSIAAVTMLVATLGVAAQVNAADSTEYKMSVCVANDIGFSALSLAQKTASRMFAKAGVTIDWRPGLAGCPAQGISISLSGQVPADLPLHALAYALPYEGSHIVIFYDRLREIASPPQISFLLAHVLVHEVTHILQGIPRHSDRGVMKATWGGADYKAMTWKPLPFTPEDIELIHRGLAARAARAASPSR